MLQTRLGAAFVAAVYGLVTVFVPSGMSRNVFFVLCEEEIAAVSVILGHVFALPIWMGGFDGWSNDPAAYIHLDNRAHHYFPL